jgi:hypothetical protein
MRMNQVFSVFASVADTLISHPVLAVIIGGSLGGLAMLRACQKE